MLSSRHVSKRRLGLSAKFHLLMVHRWTGRTSPIRSGGAAPPFAQAVKHNLGVGDVEEPGSQLVDLSSAATELDQEGGHFKDIDVLLLSPGKR